MHNKLTVHMAVFTMKFYNKFTKKNRTLCSESTVSRHVHMMYSLLHDRLVVQQVQTTKFEVVQFGLNYCASCHRLKKHDE